MPLTTAQQQVKLRDLTAKFDKAMSAAKPVYPDICFVRKSKRYDEKYGWLGAMPAIKEWIGDRQFEQLRAANFVLKNRPWESSCLIARNDLEDDELDTYGDVLADLGVEAAHHPDELLFEIIDAGESTPCWDGTSFYATDHEWGKSGVQSNHVTFTAADPNDVTINEFKSALRLGFQTMIGLKRDNGKHYHRGAITTIDDAVLAVPTELRDVAYDAIESEIVDNDTNVILDKPKILPVPYLTSGVKFHLWRTGQAMKPFVFQDRQPLKRQMKDDRESKDVKFMTDARYNVGVLAWWNAMLVEFVS